MAIQYSAGTRENNTSTVTSKTTLFTLIDSSLTGAGWTITTTTSSTNKIYQSALTPQNNQIKVQVWDDGGTTNCIRIRMMNVPQTVSQTDSCYLFPGTSTTYQMIATQYQFFIFVPGSISSRNFVMASALYLPPNLVSLGLAPAAIILGDGGSDTDTSNSRGSFRTSMTSRGFAGAAPAQGWTILNSTAVEYSNLAADSSPHPGLPAMAIQQSASMDSISGYRWHDNSGLIMEPLVGWGAPTIDSEHKLRGQFWDSILSTESYPADTTTTFAVNTYYNLTYSNNGSVSAPSTMRGSFLIISA